MRKIYLYGSLAKQCGCDTVDLDVETAGEAVMALCVNFDGVEETFRRDNWALFRGDPATGFPIDEEALAGLRLGNADLHIMPEAIGAKKNDGLLKAIVGVALLAVSFGGASFLSTTVSKSLFGSATWGNVIGQVGLAMTLSGISTMMAPEETSDDNEDESSFVFSGPRGNIGQGYPVPVLYGELIVAGVVISAGVDANELEITDGEPENVTGGSQVVSDPTDRPTGLI